MSKTRSQFTYPTTPENGIPAFNSVEEEAEFWDTHDTTDLTELHPVDLTVDSELVQELVVPLAAPEFKQLIDVARAQGAEPVALARAWIEERLRRGTGSRPE